MTDGPCLQERFAPQSRCFGCGPANDRGLRIRSFEVGDAVVCDWQPRPEHEAWDGVLNGGIVGALFDCHSNWTAAIHLRRASGADPLPSTVTAEFAVKLRRPTPSAGPVRIVARVIEATADRATVEATLSADGRICATCRGIFVAVPPSHPAYHRW